MTEEREECFGRNKTAVAKSLSWWRDGEERSVSVGLYALVGIMKNGAVKTGAGPCNVLWNTGIKCRLTSGGICNSSCKL